MGTEEDATRCRFAAGATTSESRRLPKPRDEPVDAMAATDEG